MDADVWLRAARRTASLSQRELAARAKVPLSTVSRIEARLRQPALNTFESLLRATGHELVIVDASGRPVEVDHAAEQIRDRGGRHFPPHLPWEPMRDWAQYSNWWGWNRIAWWRGDPSVPSHNYWHPREPSTERPPTDDVG